MRKVLCLFCVLCALFSLSSCKQTDNTTILTKDNVIETNDILLETIRDYSLNLSSYSTSSNRFRAVGNTRDKEQSDYIQSVFETIGLTNIQQEEVILDGWNYTGINMAFMCNCDDVNQLFTFSQMGAYPSNFNYTDTVLPLYNIGTGVELDYLDSNVDVSNSGVLFLNTTENIKDCVNLAISKGASFIIYCANDITSPLSFKVDMSIGISTEIPVFVLPRGNYNTLIKAVELGKSIDITFNGFSQLQSNISTNFISGEIKGRTDEYVYVTANRDSISDGFMSSSVSVSELFCIANNLINDKIQPKYTIKFVVTTGQEWGKIGEGKNQGIAEYLKMQDVSKIKEVLILDGSKPIEGQTLTETHISDETLKSTVNTYNTSFFRDKNVSISNIVNSLNNNRVTESLEWQKHNIPVILQAEATNSIYYTLEDTSLDNASLGINNWMVVLIDYYTGLIKELVK